MTPAALLLWRSTKYSSNILSMDKIRLGIIGLGNIGKYHAEYLLNRKINRCELVAVCDKFLTSPEKYQSLKIFTDGEQLIKSGDVDAVIIATPHFQHTTLGIAAFENGVHALIEKPISSHKADAENSSPRIKNSPKSSSPACFNCAPSRAI